MRFLAIAIPAWMTLTIGLAAFVGSCGVLWSKVLNPLRKAADQAEKMYPFLVALTDTFADHPHYLSVLDDIASQFKTDGGSSLRDVVNELMLAAEQGQAAAGEARIGAEGLKVGVEASRILAERDREQLARLILVVDRLDTKVAGGRDAIDRMTADRVEVAANLAIAQAAVDKAERDRAQVAANLAKAQAAVDALAVDAAAALHRADAVPADAPAGEAADVASRSEP